MNKTIDWIKMATEFLKMTDGMFRTAEVKAHIETLRKSTHSQESAREAFISVAQSLVDSGDLDPEIQEYLMAIIEISKPRASAIN